MSPFFLFSFVAKEESDKLYYHLIHNYNWYSLGEVILMIIVKYCIENCETDVRV